MASLIDSVTICNKSIATVCSYHLTPKQYYSLQTKVTSQKLSSDQQYDLMLNALLRARITKRKESKKVKRG